MTSLNIPFHFAPVQGHTDHAYRMLHAQVYPGIEKYYTPFIRAEKGLPRRKDIVDLTADFNSSVPTIPQVIFRNKEELECLIKALVEEKTQFIDLNMGCPFPLQTARGRGAAAIGNASLISDTAEVLKKYPTINFSLKMRLGMNLPNEWKESLDILNSMPLTHITVHPRIARQQYKGEIDFQSFEEIISLIQHPVIYNGDIRIPEDVEAIINKYPTVAGIMIGRGLLGRPSLVSELIEGRTWTKDERIEKMLFFHERLFEYYSGVLQGDVQLLSKISPFWEYAEEEIGRKAWKQIKKASSIPKYLTAIAKIDN